MTESHDRKPTVVLTGATGFLGHYLLAELLRRGCRCTVLLRTPESQSSDRLADLLNELGIDADRRIAEELLVTLEGELLDQLPRVEADDSTILVHLAAATKFEPNTAGEPEKTNVLGTRRLFAWAQEMGIRHIHLVSSAYSCGRRAIPVREVFDTHPPRFHNEYERTKWESERIGFEWASAPGRRFTIYRPSIVVGAFESGRATKFGGFYLSARATELVDRMHRGCCAHERQAIPLRIAGNPLDRQNIVPVDHVAAVMATVLCNPAYAGLIYHLVHPNPPTNLQIKQAFERYFGIGGGRFVPPEVFERIQLNEHERSFHDVSRSIRHYFVDTPTFLRDNTARVEDATGIQCPSYDWAAIARLLQYAQSARWGRCAIRGSRRSEDYGCAQYFESFLPAHIPKSKVARMTALTAAVRFVIEDEPDGQWICRFVRGRLAEVHRGANGFQEDLGYRTTRAVFWESVSGRPHPQELFLSGRAEMFGDIERALKMAMILHAFTQEFPCDRTALARFGQEACSKS